MNGVFSIHYDGPIVTDHKLSVRVMARTYEHMQRAIDRAYLDQKYGQVWKHARLKADDYAATDFIAEYPREGGIILDGVRAGAAAIIDRINAAVIKPFEQALEHGVGEHALMLTELEERRSLAEAHPEKVVPYQTVADQPDPKVERAYSDRSIVKEIDQITTMIRSAGMAGSHVELQFIGTGASTYSFDSDQARRFHFIVSRRQLGEPVLVRARIRLLDQGNKFARMKAKILNLDSGREVTLHLASDQDFVKLHPHHTSNEVLLIACPVIEFGAYDAKGGDMFFVDVVE